MVYIICPQYSILALMKYVLGFNRCVGNDIVKFDILSQSLNIDLYIWLECRIRTVALVY